MGTPTQAEKVRAIRIHRIEHLLRIRCSFCGAPAGELCRTKAGQEILLIGSMHNARITPTRVDERYRRYKVKPRTTAAGSGGASISDQQQPLCDEVELPANRSAYAVLKDDLKKETGGTTHSILRIASWIAKIGGSIKRKIRFGVPRRG